VKSGLPRGVDVVIEAAGFFEVFGGAQGPLPDAVVDFIGAFGEMGMDGCV
jgi:hypothetical protein